MGSAIDEDVIVAVDQPCSVQLAGKYAPAHGHRIERRQFSRQGARDLDWIRTVRLRTAGEVSLVDLSAGGALIDSRVPLRPGATLSLEIVGRGLETTVTLYVLRCHIAELMADRARYRGACEFASPIELPALLEVTDVSNAGADPFVGVDSALKALVQRVYAGEASERLAPGDVMLVLQSLARRSSSMDDPFGRQIGALLQELLPALRHGQGLPSLLTTIERQLRQTLPHARLRLLDRRHGPEPESRSVVIRPPDGGSAAVSVSIDLPSSLVVNDAQARLLRTSSRLIALVQRLNGHIVGSNTESNAAMARARETDAAATPGAWQKIVVRYADGLLLKGFTQDFHASKSQFSLWPSTTAAPHERVVVPFARLKAVFFVREFAGNSEHVERKVFDSPAHGRRIEVTLLDGEVLVGTTLNYRADSTGFFVMPADPRTNNQRVFVVTSAVRQVRFP